MDFKGKVAMVTGGANGIGKGISTALLNIGMKLSICDISDSAANLFIEELSADLKPKVIYVKCNVSSADHFRAAFQKTLDSFGRIDIVINNAGIMNEHEWKKVVDVNFIGVIHGIQLALEFMDKNNSLTHGSGGIVINIASNAGLNPFPLAPVYSGCKHGVVGLTKSYGQPFYFERTGVTVNAVCPGSTNTQLFHTFPASVLYEDVAREHNMKAEPMSPDEVAKAVVQLLQDGKNGALLSIDQEGARYVD